MVGVPALPTTIDPALASDPGALQALWLVYTPLLTFATPRVARVPN